MIQNVSSFLENTPETLEKNVHSIVVWLNMLDLSCASYVRVNWIELVNSEQREREGAEPGPGATVRVLYSKAYFLWPISPPEESVASQNSVTCWKQSIQSRSLRKTFTFRPSQCFWSSKAHIHPINETCTWSVSKIAKVNGSSNWLKA